jgi:hypothetical protein
LSAQWRCQRVCFVQHAPAAGAVTGAANLSPTALFHINIAALAGFCDAGSHGWPAVCDDG